MLDSATLREVLAACLAGGGDFAEIFVEKKRVTGIACEAGKVDRAVSGLDLGAGLRVLRGEHTAYAYTNDLTKEGMLQAARVVAGAAVGPGKELRFDLTKKKAPCNFVFLKHPDRAGVEEKVGLVYKANQAAWEADSRVRQVSVSYGDTVQEVIIANSEGLCLEDERVRTRLAVNVVAAQGEVVQTGYEAAGGLTGLELFEKEDPSGLGKKAAGRALLMLAARPAPAGRMAVVMAGEAGGTMVHEACGHGLEADLVGKQLSVYAGMLGRQVARPEVTIIDDATLSGAYGSFCLDDEGTPGERTVLIAGGVLQGYMQDLLTSRKSGARPTGNGRRESYQHKPIPRMTNTFLAPGKMDPNDIIKAVGRGLLVKKMGGGQVNTTTGDFVFEVAEGYLIENGIPGEPVRGATLTGNGPEVLKQIEMVGRDLGFAIGTCGKDGQGVPVSDAQPTIAIREMVVGGTEHNGGGAGGCLYPAWKGVWRF